MADRPTIQLPALPPPPPQLAEHTAWWRWLALSVLVAGLVLGLLFWP